MKENLLCRVGSSLLEFDLIANGLSRYSEAIVWRVETWDDFVAAYQAVRRQDDVHVFPRSGIEDLKSERSLALSITLV